MSTLVLLILSCAVLAWKADSLDCKDSSSCNYSGQCSSYTGRCLCNSNAYGSKCEYTCSGCSNGGTCISESKCTCPSGYTGNRCQKSRCNPLCQNGGTCEYDGNCYCLDGYRGNYCQYTSGGSSGIIAASVVAGVFIMGCSVCIVFLRIWLRVRMISRRRHQQRTIPTSAGHVVVISQTTAAPRPPDAPPPYVPSELKPPESESQTGTGPGTTDFGPFSTGNAYLLPVPPYSGPSPLYSGPTPPETTGSTSSHFGPTLEYTGPAPDYVENLPLQMGSDQSVVDSTVANDRGVAEPDDNAGDDVPLLLGN